jgi:hypothetical protein
VAISGLVIWAIAPPVGLLVQTACTCHSSRHLPVAGVDIWYCHPPARHPPGTIAGSPIALALALNASDRFPFSPR